MFTLCYKHGDVIMTLNVVAVTLNK